MKKLILLASLVLPMFAQAQNYSIDWYKVAGGGGTSSGGNYTLTGTIGQHDAGKIAGGNYTIEGGFLAGIGLVQTPGAPLLSMRLTNNNVSAVISWPVSATGFVLEETATLATPLWTTNAVSITTNGAEKNVTIPANVGMKYFRLRKP
jgi:hypothetical protein